MADTEEFKVPNKISKLLKRRRDIKAFPYTYSQLAAAADVSRNTVWNLAKGEYWPKLDTAYRISRALNTTVYEVWGETDVMSFLRMLDEAEQERIMKAVAGAISEE